MYVNPTLQVIIKNVNTPEQESLDNTTSNEHLETSNVDSPCNDLLLSDHASVITEKQDEGTALRRSTRKRQKPERFRDSDFTTRGDSSDSTIKSTSKVKRLLACKIVDGRHKYLVHLCGEPAQNARWMDLSDLNIKAKQMLKKRPPPLIS